MAQTPSSTEAVAVPRRRLFSKLVRAAALAAGEEVIASRMVPSDTNKHGGVTSRVPKMALYGAVINATLTSLLLRALRAMRGSSRSQLTQLLVTLFIAAPIQKLAHFASVAYAHGAHTFSRLRNTVRTIFLPSVALLAIVASAALAFAHMFLPQRLRQRFFQYLRFLINVYDNVIVKRALRKAERREERKNARRRATEESESSGPEPAGEPARGV